VVFFVAMNTVYEVESTETARVAEGDPNKHSIGITKVTMERIMKLPKWSDAMALYCFYLYTSRWQETTIVRCTNNYACKALKWSERKLIRTKMLLAGLGLIENIVKSKRGADGRHCFGESYVVVKYLVNTL
jgi:hypothetical protein